MYIKVFKHNFDEFVNVCDGNCVSIYSNNNVNSFDDAFTPFAIYWCLETSYQ